MIRKNLSLLLLSTILLVPAIHKILGELPPNWFIEKFNDSIIGKVPGGISISYSLIILMELVGPVLLLAGLVQLNRKKHCERLISAGFLTCYFLFLTLTFGSFLVQDYDNGFKDFFYFVGILLIEHLFFSREKKPGSE